MKISKLFHWLYALLMLLPAFFVGGRMAYTIFNKNAKDSYFGETINETIMLDVDTLESNKKYIFTASNVQDLTTRTQNIYPISVVVLAASNNTIINNVNNNTIDRIFFANSGSINSYVAFSSGTSTYYLNLKTESISFEFTYNSGDITDSFLMNLIKEYSYNKYSYLDNAFDYSMSQLNELPLFSWAKDSFIVEPFTYITGLFGMPSDSPVLTLLSYWCSISLIWLTFDLLMYVPLLVHRWLDKGVLE